MRIDQLLVERGLAASRSQAQRLIAAGVTWRLHPGDWQRVGKNRDDVPEAAELVLQDDAESRYVSRGGLKLEGALRQTGLQVAGLRCLDVGQSTGGFTDCLLQFGAAQVVGVDVGHAQVHERIRSDERVTCIEGLNARELQLDDERMPDGTEGFDVLVGDVSFISLTLVLPGGVHFLKPEGHLLMLVKPQFELQPGQVGKHGIVRDPALYDIVQARVRAALLDLGLKVNAWMDSMIDGGDGNKEFFVHAVWAQPETVLARRAHIRQDREAAAAQALQDALDDY
jgi:23S rRNA (cytidine1920-2'-O)/16S rRNA (cytidine1409-2'-O)-methyltransferase